MQWGRTVERDIIRVNQDLPPTKTCTITHYISCPRVAVEALICSPEQHAVRFLPRGSLLGRRPRVVALRTVAPVPAADART